MTVSERDVGQRVRTSAGHEGVLKRVMRRWEDPHAPSWDRGRPFDAAFVLLGRGRDKVVPVDEVAVVHTVPSPDGRGRRR
ncbi:hypothetical protein GCM10010357_28690 [Streptomyces luteireticuli]|uniref:Uncharacterized protein n=1 Tax=Streptomyces luteireticuli TaxID=173858 RepID=A0ABP3IJ35_9ACTN